MEEEEAGQGLVRPGCGVLLGLQVLVGVHQEGRKGEGSGGEGEVAGPLFPSPIRTRGEGGRSSPLALSPLPTKAHQGPILLPANSRNSPVLRKIPESLGTFPNSEYSRPIYRSLRLDHFETPRHVPDLIRDSELLRYIKTHNITIIETLSVRTLRVRELCRHDRDTSPVNNQ